MWYMNESFRRLLVKHFSVKIGLLWALWQITFADPVVIEVRLAFFRPDGQVETTVGSEVL